LVFCHLSKLKDYDLATLKKKGAKACDFCCETYLEIVNKTKKLEHGP